MKRIIAYILLFVAVFGITVYLRFPYAEVVRGTLAQKPLPAGIRLEFASLSPSWLGLSGRQLVVRQGDRDLLRASRFRVGGLLSTLWGSPRLNTTLDIFGGRLRMAVSAAEGGRYEVEADGDQLGAGPLLALLRDGLGEITGKIDTHLAYTGIPARWTQGKGEVEVSGGPGQLTGLTLLGQDVPPIPYDKLRGRLTLDKGFARVEKWSLTGPGLSATVDGRLHLRPRLESSILDLTCQLQLPDPVTTQMADLLDLAAQYRQRDGSYKLRLRGSVGQPRLR